jgi:hypothetical protein
MAAAAGVEAPIAEAVVQVLYENVPPREAVERLMTRALRTELFPTEFRGTGTGTLALLETVGVGVGLLVYAAVAAALGSQPIAIVLVALACLGAAASVFLVPETARRELEEVSADAA